MREEPARLHVLLRDPRGIELALGYRSDRGLFYRTYFLVGQAEVRGTGPSAPARLVLRRRGLVWKRPRPPEARRWREAIAGREFRAALKRGHTERLTLDWRPHRGTWVVYLETLSGGLTTTFFPPLDTPNPLFPDEADALFELLAALASVAVDR